MSWHTSFRTGYSKVLNIYRVTATSTSKTLATLTVTTDPRAKAYVITQNDPTQTVYFNNGTASTSTGRLNPDGESLPATANLINVLQFYAATDAELTIREFG